MKHASSATEEAHVVVTAGAASLRGDLVIPRGARGIVVFAHGSGSGRNSPRNRYVAHTLQQAGLGTLLMDLLTMDEEELDLQTREFRFDIDLLAKRLEGATDWLLRQEATRHLNIGYFGASTGAAAALVAAARRPAAVGAIVSRGGRPDLAGDALQEVITPTLLIVGGNDTVVIGLNEQAFQKLAARDREMHIVPGATHLFEETGALDAVASRAAEWFVRYLGGPDERRG